MRKFKVKLEGPSCSGKSTFINALVHNFENSRFIITGIKEHELEVTTFPEAFPKMEEKKGEEEDGET